MQDNGIESVVSLSRETGISQAILGGIANLKHPAYDKNFELRNGVRRLIEYFNVSVHDLYPEDHLYVGLKTNTSALELSAEEINGFMTLTEDTLNIKNLEVEMSCKSLIPTIENNLSEREIKVIQQRHYEGLTFREIATTLGVSKDRVRQIEAKAFKKARRSIELLEIETNLNRKKFIRNKKIEKMPRHEKIKYLKENPISTQKEK